MTAATLSIGPDGVARIEIVLRLEITVRTEEVARAAGGNDRVDPDEQLARDGGDGAGRELHARDVGRGPGSQGGSPLSGPGDAGGEPDDVVGLAAALDAEPAPAAHAGDHVPLSPAPAADPEPEPAPLEGGQPTIEPLLERLRFDLDGLEPLPPRIHLEAVPDGVDDLADVLGEPTVADDDIATADRDAAAPSNDNPGGADDLSPAPLAVDATGTPDRAGIDGDVPTDPVPTRAARSKREGRKTATAPRRTVERVLPAPRIPPPARPQRPLPPLPGRPNRALTQAEIDAARAAGRFQRLPAIDERLGQVAIVESVDDAKTQLARLGHKVREIDRNTFKVDARRFDRTSFLQFARTAVRMEAARKKGLVAA